MSLLIRLTFAICMFSLVAAAKARHPNIIFILADDLGYGDLGCFGQTQIETPHLDQMAKDGLRLTDHYSGSTVCAPSRCVLMTGKHLGHAEIRDNRYASPTSNKPLADEAVTIAELLKGQGYATAVIGKWGLGDQHNSGFPNAQGFDYSFGYLSQGHAHNYFPEYLFRNGEKVYLRNFVPVPRPNGAGTATVRDDYSADRITDEALQWMKLHRRTPFFLYLASTLPHANNEAGRRGQEVPDYGQYADRDWPEPQKGTAAMITRLDAMVGRVRGLLEELELADDTLIIFSSDNGPHAEGGNDPAFFQSAGPLRGIKRDLYEGGIRVPTLVLWPGRTKAGRVDRTPSAFQDWLPTLAQVAGADVSANVDGISLLPAITGDGACASRDYLYWEFYERGGKRAIRSGDWKAVQLDLRTSPKPIELYQLSHDLGEQHNVASEYPDIVDRLERWMDAAHQSTSEYSLTQP